MSALPQDYLSQFQDHGFLAAGRGQDGDRLLLVEKRRYGEGLDPKELVLRRIQKLARLLSEVSRPEFSIARFVGYIDQPLRGQMGLVFDANMTANSMSTPQPFLTLEQAYQQEKFVPLESRFALALSLAKALSNLHAVGWLHKSLRSANIVFFPTSSSCLSSTTTPKFNLTRPYLFGFDLSRHSADESLNDREFQRSRQIYTHPWRWGVPQESFYAVHDIYALGVILLEIGCWRSAAGFDRSKRGFADVNDEAQIQEVLVAAVETYLRHRAGGRYTSAVLACLTNGFEEEAKGIMGDNLLRLHRAFGEKVVRNLDLARAGLGLGEESRPSD